MVVCPVVERPLSHNTGGKISKSLSLTKQLLSVAELPERAFLRSIAIWGNVTAGIPLKTLSIMW